MVSTYGDYSATLVSVDSPYKTMADLKGKKVGVAVGSGAHMTWLVYLDENGFKAEDFQVVNMKGEDHAAALSTKAVDAITTWEPYVSIMEYKGIGRVVALYGKHVYDMAVLQGRTEDIKRNRRAYVKMVAGALDSQELIHKNPSEAAKIVSEGLQKRGVEAPQQAFEKIFKERLIFKPEFEPVKSSLDKLSKLMIKLGRIKQEPVFTWGDDILAEAQRLRKSKSS